MINPFFSYSLAFAIAIFVYLLGWSDLYPKPSILLFLFLSFTFLFHFICGKRIHKSGAIRFKLLPINHRADLVTLLIYVLWIVEFIYEGGVPLVKIILNQPYNYRLFGVPSLHVFVVTFSSFYTVYLFQVFLSHPSRKIFLLFLVNLLAALLIYSRAMFFFNLTSCLFIYIIFSEKVTIKKIVSISLCLIPLLFLFGVLGSLRVSREAKTPYSNDSFLNTGRATDEFRRSIIPKEYFWAYIYISSPLANLQQNINEYPVAALSPRSIAELFNSEVLPDFISKRINRLFNLKQYEDKRITGPFNVSTVYSRSYSYAGWPGLILMALVIISIPLVLLKILPPSSDFFLSGWVILCTMYLYLSYDNMLRFTGLSLQLAYPILLHWIGRKIPKAVKIK